jgi:hypothetical protein
MIRHYERFNIWFSTFLFLSSLHYCGDLKVVIDAAIEQKGPNAKLELYSLLIH